jgi:PAS domain S-box-containing protein
MRSDVSPNLTAWPRPSSGVAAICVILIGLAVLLGWTFDFTALQSVSPAWTKMSPLTAAGFILAGLGLAMLALGNSGYLDKGRARRAIGQWSVPVLGATVAVIGAVRLFAHLLHWDIGIDNLWFGEEAKLESLDAQMGPAVALNFLLIGCALLLVNRTYFKTFQTLLLLAAMVAWLGFSHYFYGGAPLASYADMALHTSIAFLILSGGLLCARTEFGLMELLVSDTAGGMITRRLVPAVLFFPVILGWLRLRALRSGLIGTEAGIPIFTLANVAVFGALVWRSAVLLQQTDANRTAAERSLRDSQVRLESALESGGIGTWSYDVATNESWLDDSLTALFGRSSDDMAGGRPEVFFSFVHHDDAPRAVAAFQEAVHETGNYHTEFRYVRPDGTIIWLTARGRLECDQLGRPLRMRGACVDITERKLAEGRLQTHLSRLELLNRITRAIGERQDLRSIYQVVIRRLEDDLPVDFCCIADYDAISETLTVTNVGVKSRDLARSLGMSEQASVPIDQNGLSSCVRGLLVYEPDITNVQMPFPQRLLSGGLHSFVAAPLLVESKVFGVLIAGRLEADSFSSPDCEFLRQLSEQVALAAQQAQLYEALQEAYDDLRQTQQNVMQHERLRALGQMSSGIAHDINNAISPAMVYAELLQQDPSLSPEARASLGTIERAMDDVAATVARLREFYRERAPEVSLVPVQLNAVAQQVLDLTRAKWVGMAQRTGVVIQTKMDLAADLPEIMGAENEIREALTNLIFNAVDAMPRGGTITVRTGLTRDAAAGAVESEERVFLEVVDNGIGMDEATQRRCLEPFFTTKGEQGTGLGLAMVYGTIERHSAEIEVHSTVGEGTTMGMIFSVPAAKAVAPVELVAAEAIATAQRILIVDDDPVLLESLRDALELDHHTVVAAPGGQEGIDKFHEALKRDESFAVVITDLGMPYVDGRQVATAVKAASATTPVILFTGWGQRMIANQEIPPHVDRVLSKPPKLRDLRAALAECLGRVEFRV